MRGYTAAKLSVNVTNYVFHSQSAMPEPKEHRYIQTIIRVDDARRSSSPFGESDLYEVFSSQIFGFGMRAKATQIRP